MHRVSRPVLILVVFCLSSNAFSLFQRQESGPAVVNLKVQRSTLGNGLALQRRQGVEVDLDNEITAYTANVSLGTPPQDFRVRVDTGSSDLWTNTPNSQICSLAIDPCSDSGTYTANSSSSYDFVNDNFQVSYADGSGASGDYATDNVTIGDVSIDRFQFGIGYQSASPDAILGIGYRANEAQVNSGGGKQYSNLPQAMVDAGFIKSNAYSMWLDDLQASTGSILFGGIDTDKYQGALRKLPVQKIRGAYIQFAITVNRMSIISNGRNQTLRSSLPVGVILDSGSTISYLPNDLVGDIYDAFNVRFSRSQGSGLCDCDLANQDASIEFTFTEPTIRVPISELVINPTQEQFQKRSVHEKRQGFVDGGICLFGIAPSSGSVSILGDTFLRSAYTVYDLANNEISIAQTNFNSTTSKIQEIGTGDDSVPDSTPVSNVVTASITAGGAGRIGNPTATSSGGNDPVSFGTDRASILSTPLLVAMLLVNTGFIILFSR